MIRKFYDTDLIGGGNLDFTPSQQPVPQGTEGVYAVDLSWGIKWDETDLSNVMEAKDCRFVGTAKECADFILFQKPTSQHTEVGNVWHKASPETNPSKDINEHFVCMIEKRGDGKVTVKPAYGQWLYSQWLTEEGWTVIEWLSQAPLPEHTVQGYSKEQMIVCHLSGQEDAGSKHPSMSDAMAYVNVSLPAQPAPTGKVDDWISVEDENMPLETDIIVKHPFGVEAIHFFNAEWKFWYTGKTCGSDLIKNITHWQKPLTNNHQ